MQYPYYFSEEDVLAIFSVCSNIKHLAMLQTLFYGCLRSTELCKLDDSDLNLSTRTIFLRETKNGSDGIAYINSDCAETLRLYLKIRPQIKIGDRTPLFYTDSMNFWYKNEVVAARFNPQSHQTCNPPILSLPEEPRTPVG